MRCQGNPIAISNIRKVPREVNFTRGCWQPLQPVRYLRRARPRGRHCGPAIEIFGKAAEAVLAELEAKSIVAMEQEV
jgi:hypothetical protein